MADKDRLVTGYAQALFSVAEAEGTLETVEDELFRFGKAVERDPGLRDALVDPSLPVDRKKAVLQELLGDKAGPHTVGLLGFIVEQGRAKDLPRIVTALAEVAAERRRKAVAEVRVAVPLDAARRASLEKALARATDRDVELKVLVDPTVIGGVVARVGDQVFDGTIRRRLSLARERLGIKQIR
jgi:F-type H+-transporting ATPase subunit delta